MMKNSLNATPECKKSHENDKKGERRQKISLD